MTCPFCGHKQDRVIDSRESKEGEVVRRRRECLSCDRRFTTYERSDEIPYMVVKRDGRREKFDRQKVLEGLLKACQKRPIPMAKLAEAINEVESALSDSPEREMPSTAIGEMLMNRLRSMEIGGGAAGGNGTKLSARFSQASFQKIMQPAWQPPCALPSQRVSRWTARWTRRPRTGKTVSHVLWALL